MAKRSYSGMEPQRGGWGGGRRQDQPLLNRCYGRHRDGRSSLTCMCISQAAYIQNVTLVAILSTKISKVGAVGVEG